MSSVAPSYVVALSGGLGNQMFQYALGRCLAVRHEAKLLLDTTMLETDPLRSYALDAFSISADIASSSALPVSGKWANRLRRRLPRWLQGRQQVVEGSFSFDPTVLETDPPVRLVGNWQSEKYFAQIADLIRRDFTPRRELTKIRQAIADVILTAPAISLHVRRGDYVTNAQTQAYHGSLTVEWYSAAARAMADRVPSAHYFVFSDDPHWAEQNLSLPAEVTYVPVLGDGHDWEDMRLMSLCQHHIIANSSFSWWGAWLNPSADKMVVAPRNWFSGASHDTKDLIPTSWTRL